MKKITLLSTLILFLSVSLIAQIQEAERSMSVGVHNALILELPNVTNKLAEKQWKKYAKEYGKTKYQRKHDEFFTNNADIPSINGDNGLDLYARVSEEGDKKYLLVWFDLGGAYLSSAGDVDKFKNAEKLLLEFGLQIAKEKIRLDLKDAEKELKKKENHLQKLEKNKKSYEREIEIAKAKIVKSEEKIEQNIKDQETANLEIVEQKELVQETKDRLSELD